ncbi:hypothetical protein RCO27_18985 [Sphingosinicella sp. LHD-64]|uniref:hypothetical protein n=1 Tax=Sphingosinicella sp. LHD-64 TaxID=3072139 RepID=UPI00281035AA|nr:hypothetical protein [Sphingosinicella sp. LHD-64]MDQ8758319.1 hypothetical protein [Sphingosinicella sp. LHD-64]
MNFYVPHHAGARGDRLWHWARADLAKHGLATTRRRIRALIWYDDEGEEHYVMVGGETPGGEDDDPVMTILESGDLDDLVFVCTLSRLANGEPPFALSLGRDWKVVDFDDGASA